MADIVNAPNAPSEGPSGEALIPQQNKEAEGSEWQGPKKVQVFTSEEARRAVSTTGPTIVVPGATVTSVPEGTLPEDVPTAEKALEAEQEKPSKPLIVRIPGDATVVERDAKGVPIVFKSGSETYYGPGSVPYSQGIYTESQRLAAEGGRGTVVGAVDAQGNAVLLPVVAAQAIQSVKGLPKIQLMQKYGLLPTDAHFHINDDLTWDLISAGDWKKLSVEDRELFLRSGIRAVQLKMEQEESNRLEAQRAVGKMSVPDFLAAHDYSLAARQALITAGYKKEDVNTTASMMVRMTKAGAADPLKPTYQDIINAVDAHLISQQEINDFYGEGTIDEVSKWHADKQRVEQSEAALRQLSSYRTLPTPEQFARGEIPDTYDTISFLRNGGDIGVLVAAGFNPDRMLAQAKAVAAISAAGAWTSDGMIDPTLAPPEALATLTGKAPPPPLPAWTGAEAPPPLQWEDVRTGKVISDEEHKALKGSELDYYHLTVASGKQVIQSKVIAPVAGVIQRYKNDVVEIKNWFNNRTDPEAPWWYEGKVITGAQRVQIISDYETKRDALIRAGQMGSAEWASLGSNPADKMTRADVPLRPITEVGLAAAAIPALFTPFPEIALGAAAKIPLVSLVPRITYGLLQLAARNAPAVYTAAVISEGAKASDLERKWQLFQALPESRKDYWAKQAGYDKFEGLSETQQAATLARYSVPAGVTLETWTASLAKVADEAYLYANKGSRWILQHAPSPVSMPLSFAGGVVVGALAMVPAYTAMIPTLTAQLIDKVPEGDASLFAAATVAGMAAFFTTGIPAMMKQNPSLASGALAGMFVIGPKGVLKLAEGLGARLNLRYAPERGMAVEWSVIRAPTTLGGENLDLQVRSATEQAIKGLLEGSKSVKAVRGAPGEYYIDVAVGDGVFRMKYLGVAYQDVKPYTVFSGIPDVTKLPEKLILWSSPEYARRFAMASSGGEPMVNPAIIETYLGPKGFRELPGRVLGAADLATMRQLMTEAYNAGVKTGNYGPFKEWRDRIELETTAMTKYLEPVPGPGGRGITANITMGAYPIYRYIMGGLGLEGYKGTSISEALQIRAKAAVSATYDAFLGWKGRMEALKRLVTSEKTIKPSELTDYLTNEGPLGDLAQLIQGRRSALKTYISPEEQAILTKALLDQLGMPEFRKAIGEEILNRIKSSKDPEGELRRVQDKLLDDLEKSDKLTAAEKQSIRERTVSSIVKDMLRKELGKYASLLEGYIDDFRDDYYRTAGFYSSLEKLRYRALGERVPPRVVTPEEILPERTYIERAPGEAPSIERVAPRVSAERILPERVLPERIAPEISSPRVIVERGLPERMPPERVPPERIPPEETPPERVPPERTPPERTPPERIPPERVPPEEVPPEIVTGKRGGVTIEQLREYFRNSYGWPQGFGYWAIKPDTKEKRFFYKTPPPGFRDVRQGTGEAYRGIQALEGVGVGEQTLKMGFQQVIVSSPTSEPGRPGAIIFRRLRKGEVANEDINLKYRGDARDRERGLKFGSTFEDALLHTPRDKAQADFQEARVVEMLSSMTPIEVASRLRAIGLGLDDEPVQMILSHMPDTAKKELKQRLGATIEEIKLGPEQRTVTRIALSKPKPTLSAAAMAAEQAVELGEKTVSKKKIALGTRVSFNPASTNTKATKPRVSVAKTIIGEVTEWV